MTLNHHPFSAIHPKRWCKMFHHFIRGLCNKKKLCRLQRWRWICRYTHVIPSATMFFSVYMILQINLWELRQQILEVKLYHAAKLILHLNNSYRLSEFTRKCSNWLEPFFLFWNFFFFCLKQRSVEFWQYLIHHKKYKNAN